MRTPGPMGSVDDDNGYRNSNDDNGYRNPKHQSREGDWTCPKCGDLVFARNTCCRKCGLKREEAFMNTPGPMGSLDEGNGYRTSNDDNGYRNPKHQSREGDWTCPKCGDLVFARNTGCRKCGLTREEAETYEAKEGDLGSSFRAANFGVGTAKVMKPGDWTCPNCD